MRTCATCAQRPVAEFHHSATSTYDAAIAPIIATIEYQRSVIRVIYHVTGDRAGGATVADLQRAIADRGSPGIRIVTSQDQCAGTTLVQRTAAAIRRSVA